MSKALATMADACPLGSYVVTFRLVTGFTAFGRDDGDMSVRGGLCDRHRKSVVLK